MISCFVKWTDFLSEAPHLYVKRTSRHKNLIGGVLSIATVCCIIGAIVNFGLQFIRRANSTILYHAEPSPYTVNVSLTSLPWMITIMNTFYESIPNQENIWYIRSQFWELKPDNSTGTNKMVTTVTEIPVEKCDINRHFGEYKSYFQNFPSLSKYYCPVPGGPSVNLYGLYGSDQACSMVQHSVARCINGINNATNCLTLPEINSIMENVYIAYATIDYNVDHLNVTSPKIPYVISQTIPISSTIYKRIWYYYRYIEYLSDFGIVFESFEGEEMFKFYYGKETVDLRTKTSIPGGVSHMTLLMDAQVDKYKRTFDKIQNLLANTGGVLKGLTFLAGIINMIFSEKLYMLSIINTVFPIRILVKNEQNLENSVQHFIGYNNIRSQSNNLRSLQ